MSRNVVITIVVVLVVIAAGWYLMRPKQPVAPATVTVESTPAPASSESSAPSAASEGAMMKGETVVKITASGFSPKAVTIKVGDSVTWMNTDSLDHTVNSAVHPTHQVYPPLNLGNVQPGGKVSLKFPTAGTYKYHDHLNPTLTGSVSVE